MECGVPLRIVAGEGDDMGTGHVSLRAHDTERGLLSTPIMDIEQLKRDIADHGPSDAQVRELLEMVKANITADPGCYKQTNFCGMQCCIGGHIDIILNGMDLHRARRGAPNEINQITDVAIEAVGEDSAPWLFGTIRESDELEADEGDPEDPEFWPPDLSDEYAASHGTARALVGCKAIDRYMKERGI